MHQRGASRLTIHDFTPSVLSFHWWARRLRRLDHGLRIQRAVLRLRVTRYDIQPPQWPADFQLRIAAIADLHACDPWMSLASYPGDRRTHQCARRGYHRPARRLCRRASPCDALHSGQRMGAGARRPEGAARRACDPRQSRLVGRQDRAARRARADASPARARSRRHSGLRKRRQAPDQGWPPVLARRAWRSTGLYAGAALPAGPAHRRR